MSRPITTQDEMALINLGIQLKHNGHQRLGEQLLSLVDSYEWRAVQKRAKQRLKLNATWGPYKLRRKQ